MAESKSKIDEFNLGKKVLELRKSNLTCEEVADEINRLYLPAGVEPISKMTVSRYCNAHGLTDMSRSDISYGVTRFDALKEAWGVRNRLVKHTNKLGKIVDELKQDEEKLSELASISNAYLNSCKLQQELNEKVSKIQKEQLGLEKVRQILSTMLEVLVKYPQVKAEIYKRFADKDLMDTIRSV